MADPHHQHPELGPERHGPALMLALPPALYPPVVHMSRIVHMSRTAMRVVRRAGGRALLGCARRFSLRGPCESATRCAWRSDIGYRRARGPGGGGRACGPAVVCGAYVDTAKRTKRPGAANWRRPNRMLWSGTGICPRASCDTGIRASHRSCVQKQGFVLGQPICARGTARAHTRAAGVWVEV